MKKLMVSLCFVLVGCIPWQFNDYEPFTPTADKSDLEFVRTGDRAYYYVIDRKRKICFFHARMYGHAHMTEIPCDRLPEYEKNKKTAKSQPATASNKPAIASKQPGTASTQTDATNVSSDTQPQKQTETTAGSPTAQPPLTTEERNGFKRSYIQYFCARKTGKAEELDAILLRHGINRERYELGKAEFSKDKDLWVSLSKEATEACK